MAYPTVLELRMKKATFFKNVPELLSGLFSTADFKFSSTGLKLQAMDSSGNAFVVLQLRSKAFDYYYCDRNPFSMALNLDGLVEAFRFANNNDTITMKYQCDDGLTFPISLESPGSNVLKRFDLDSADADVMPVSLLECDETMYQAIVRMPSVKFMHFCNKLSSFWDTGDRKAVVSISVDKDHVRFFTDKSSAIVRLQTQNGDKPNEATCIEMKEKISLTFGLSYLMSFSKASTLSHQVTIKLSSNLPALFEYKIAEMGYIRYYVTPADKEVETEGIAEEDKMQN